MKIKIFICSLLLTLFCSCTSSSQKFDSSKWREGGKIIRGSMIEDVKGSKMLLGKAKNEVIELLGNPDSENNLREVSDGQFVETGSVITYNAITVPRCYLWNCRLEIYFDTETKKVRNVEESN